MKKTKSKAAYTNIWLNRNKHLWKEVSFRNGCTLIILKTTSAPNIVSDRIKEINTKRKEKAKEKSPINKKKTSI